MQDARCCRTDHKLSSLNSQPKLQNKNYPFLISQALARFDHSFYMNRTHTAVGSLFISFTFFFISFISFSLQSGSPENGRRRPSVRPCPPKSIGFITATTEKAPRPPKLPPTRGTCTCAADCSFRCLLNFVRSLLILLNGPVCVPRDGRVRRREATKHHLHLHRAFVPHRGPRAATKVRRDIILRNDSVGASLNLEDQRDAVRNHRRRLC